MCFKSLQYAQHEVHCNKSILRKEDWAAVYVLCLSLYLDDLLQNEWWRKELHGWNWLIFFMFSLYQKNYFLRVWVFSCMHVSALCECLVSAESEEGVTVPGRRIKDGCELTCACGLPFVKCRSLILSIFFSDC